MTQPVNLVAPMAAQGRVRLGLAIALVVLAGLVAAVGQVAVWARDTALDTDTYVDTVVPLADEAELSEGVASYLTDQLFAWFDVEEIASGLLPDDLAALAGAAEPAVRPFVEDLILDVLESEAFAELWATLNREGHELLVEVLRGENDYVSIVGDQIVLDLTPVVDALDQRLDEYGIDLLDAVPDELVTFTVYESPEIGDAVEALDTLDWLASALPVSVPGLMILVAVVLVRRRLWLLGVAGVAVAGSAVLVLAIEAISQGLLLDQLTYPLAALAGQSLWDAAAGRLVGQLCLLVVAGGILAALGFGLDFARRNARGAGTPEPAK